MEEKKSPRANLNRYSSLFLWLGLVFVLFVSWRVIEYKQMEEKDNGDEAWVVNADDLEQTKEVKVEQPKIEQQQQKKAPPAEIKKVKNEEKVEDIEFESSDTDEDEVVDEPDDIQTEEPEEDVTVAFQFVESVPIYPGCEKYKDNKEKLKKCVSRKVDRFINRKFNKDIASDLGIEGVVKIYAGFVVDKNGNVVQVQARSPYKQLVQETKRVLSSMPRWTPGEQRGKKVNVRYILPIQFRVSD